MASINVLSREISELIAAGEVIERPASVIKELVENSIDSGAKYITVEIKNGGITYMRVTDDGCGMSFEDVPTAFLRHATSKIVTKDDLDNINTLGFRGEALASVAAVSKVEIMSKQKSEDYGTHYSISRSEEQLYEKSGCPDGTTIIIRDLFYNVPARAKFLKKDVTEANAISNIMQKIALSHPDISFKFIRDNKVEFNTVADDSLYSAVYAVYGKDFARDLIPVDYTYNGIKISGFIIKPLYSKNNRSFQNFFVNDRYIRSKICSAALENAYTNIIMTGKFPACVLSIYISPQNMDVNIHPSKAEVRFTDEKTVSDAIFFAVKNALMNNGLIYEFEIKPHNDWVKPAPEKEESEQLKMMFTPVENIKAEEEIIEKKEPVISENIEEKKPVEIENKMAEIENKQPEKVIENTIEKEIKKESEKISKPVHEDFKYIKTESFEKPVEAVENIIETEKIIEKEKLNIKIVGEVFGLYIIAECENKMIMIDKHAAHERIIFEQLKSRNCRQYSQKMLVGIKMLLTSEEIDVIENNTELLLDLGFAFDFSERPCIIITAVPTFIIDTDIESVVYEVITNLKLYKQNPQSSLLDDMLHTMACKAAIKAHDKSEPEQMKALVEQVYENENIRHCPHGRPVMFTMTKSNIDHQFKRT